MAARCVSFGQEPQQVEYDLALALPRIENQQSRDLNDTKSSVAWCSRAPAARFLDVPM
jgi:hypothetical protein